MWSEALQPLLEWAEAAIPRARHSTTPILLLATAGVRQLPQEAGHQLMAHVQRLLAGSVFQVGRPTMGYEFSHVPAINLLPGAHVQYPKAKDLGSETCKLNLSQSVPTDIYGLEITESRISC